MACATGYAARGTVFIILGYFTSLAAIDARRPLDTKDALKTLLTQPLGSVLLFAVAAGLLCFACWRAAQSLLDTDACGDDLRGLWRRVVYGGAALFYVGFASVAVSMIFGYAHASTDESVRDWTAWLLGKPAGQWIVAAGGLAMMAGGLGSGIAGLRAEFRARLDLAKTAALARHGARKRRLSGPRVRARRSSDCFWSSRRSIPIRTSRPASPARCASSRASPTGPC